MLRLQDGAGTIEFPAITALNLTPKLTLNQGDIWVIFFMRIPMKSSWLRKTRPVFGMSMWP